MSSKHTYSVRAGWRKRGLRCKARDYLHAVEIASLYWRKDPHIYKFGMSTGMAAERHDWGWRLFRDNKIVDIVKIAKAKGDT